MIDMHTLNLACYSNHHSISCSHAMAYVLVTRLFDLISNEITFLENFMRQRWLKDNFFYHNIEILTNHT